VAKLATDYYHTLMDTKFYGVKAEQFKNLDIAAYLCEKNSGTLRPDSSNVVTNHYYTRRKERRK